MSIHRRFWPRNLMSFGIMSRHTADVLEKKVKGACVTEDETQYLSGETQEMLIEQHNRLWSSLDPEYILPIPPLCEQEERLYQNVGVRTIRPESVQDIRPFCERMDGLLKRLPELSAVEAAELAPYLRQVSEQSMMYTGAG